MYPSFLSIQSPLLLQLQLFTSKCQYLLSKAGAAMKKNCENIFYNENIELGATKTWYRIGLVQCHRMLGLYKPNVQYCPFIARFSITHKCKKSIVLPKPAIRY